MKLKKKKYFLSLDIIIPVIEFSFYNFYIRLATLQGVPSLATYPRSWPKQIDT